MDSLLDAEETLVRAVEPALKGAFKRDEFLGRISEIIPFLPLLPGEIESIVNQILQVCVFFSGSYNDLTICTEEMGSYRSTETHH